MSNHGTFRAPVQTISDSGGACSYRTARVDTVPRYLPNARGYSTNAGEQTTSCPDSTAGFTGCRLNNGKLVATPMMYRNIQVEVGQQEEADKEIHSHSHNMRCSWCRGRACPPATSTNIAMYLAQLQQLFTLRAAAINS